MSHDAAPARAGTHARRLVVSADDFGMSLDTTDGILLAHHDGIVTSTNVMANMPDTERATRLAADHPTLDFGIHLNLTEGGPLVDPRRVPSLVNGSGCFPGIAAFLRRARRGLLRPAEVEAEFEAQVTRLLRLGLEPSHLNGHHHCHVYPTTAFAFGRVARRFGILRARLNRYRLVDGGGHTPRSRRALLTAKNSYKRLLRVLAWRGLRTADHAVSPSLVSCASARPTMAERWLALIENLPPGTAEASSHPSLSTLADEGRFRRRDELVALTSECVRRAAACNGIRLIALRDL